MMLIEIRKGNKGLLPSPVADELCGHGDRIRTILFDRTSHTLICRTEEARLTQLARLKIIRDNKRSGTPADEKKEHMEKKY